MSVKLTNESSHHGAACNTTKRIILLSPYPSSLHELVGELTAKCYDVLVMHHLDSDLFSQLNPDLLILDQRHEPLNQSALMPLLDSNISTLNLLAKPSDDSDQLSNQCIVWPADIQEITAQIVQLMESSCTSNIGMSTLVAFKDLTVDYKRIVVTQNNERIDLTRTEFDLLKVLLAADGAALSRQELLDAVWGAEYYGGSNTVDAHIKGLRNKLKDDPKSPTYIATIRGIGYRLAD
ncbi:winged helix family transcriptional regulator [Paenibacillus albiflavus]|uniref:Winged helix family transcriptional regulator n=1 Tax=Paenibacillus albiflavus TaxID=2545760 RepID=A0A4R4ENI5_9BACL|nr:winged helix-turn-helix domain-containing protein [Paenibacillus albiflavus]TCZ80091.1 winged helix family transcriptional regulator [Paenibacillus albiflavus]